MLEYQRVLTQDSTPYDPLRLAFETEQMVTRQGSEGLERKYTDFYSVPVYRGISTGYAAGCCLRCVYCWSNWSRDYPEKFGTFYSPREASQRLFKAAEEGIIYSPRWKHLKVERLRLSGCEPTIGKEHLLKLLEYIEASKYPLFILETNGILFGSDRDYVKRVSEFSKVYVRVSFKAATPEGFTERTGAEGKSYELPFKALEFLVDEGAYARAAAMTDPLVIATDERELLKEKITKISPALARDLEEERIDLYDTTIKRLAQAGFEIR